MRHAVVVAALLAACSDGEAPTPPPDPPAFAAAGATVPAGNVVSASVQLSVTGADSVAVRYRIIDSAPATDLTSPAVPAGGPDQAIMLYGLYPGQSYTATVVAYGAGGVVLSDPLAFTTGALPPDVPVYSTTGTGAEPGYTVFNAGNYGIVIDNSGRIVWYRYFPDGIGLNFQALGNGRYGTQPHTVDPTDIEPWVEVAPSGELTRSFGCANGLQNRFHDAIDDLAGGHWLMCDEVRMMDLTASGGQAAARVTGTVIQHVDAGGTALFEWSAFDHFAITDLPLADRSGANVNWTHGNAIALDTDGNIIASFRSLNEITKISLTTGAVLWRLGGLANQFHVSSSATPPFIGQHGLRPASAGLLLLDNRGEPGSSRAERYRIDETSMTATLIESFNSSPGAVGMLGGSVQELGHGHVLVSVGNGQKVEEFDGSGNVVWRLSGGTGYIFRAQRIASLYAPGVGTPR